MPSSSSPIFSGLLVPDKWMQFPLRHLLQHSHLILPSRHLLLGLVLFLHGTYWCLSLSWLLTCLSVNFLSFLTAKSFHKHRVLAVESGRPVLGFSEMYRRMLELQRTFDNQIVPGLVIIVKLVSQQLFIESLPSHPENFQKMPAFFWFPFSSP